MYVLHRTNKSLPTWLMRLITSPLFWVSHQFIFGESCLLLCLGLHKKRQFEKRRLTYKVHIRHHSSHTQNLRANIHAHVYKHCLLWRPPPTPHTSVLFSITRLLQPFMDLSQLSDKIYFFCSCGFTNVTLHWAVVNAILNIVKECQTKPVSCLVVWLGWALASIWTHAFPQCCAYCHWHDYVILEHERIICIDLSLCIHFCWDECMTWLFTVNNKGTCTCTNWLSSNC